MQRVAPTQIERKFDLQELFFSITDDKGRIEFGNDVFVKISGYSKEELIGSPHNIIRHPDMPKIVFKILWETIQSGKTIAAYVKNMAKDGSFYWVMAVVFPVGDRYLSVRMKPTTQFKSIIEESYKKLLEIEKSEGIEASRNYLTTLLDSLGFKTYEEFSTKAFRAEILARDTELKNKSQEIPRDEIENELLRSIFKEAKNASTNTENIFKKIDDLEQSNAVFTKQTAFLKEKFYDFQLLSLNIQVFSSKVGEQGRSLSVIAQNFNSLVSTVNDHLNRFAVDAKKIDEANLIFTKQICSIKFLTDMVNYFVQETLKAGKTDQSSHVFEDLSKISSTFIQLVRSTTHSFSSTQQETFLLIEQFAELNKDTRKLVNGIDLVSQIAYIEVARINSQSIDFKHSIDSMKRFSEILRESLQIITTTTENILGNIKTFDAQIEDCYGSIDKIFAYSLNQKNDLASSHP
jgi:PAS domain S-box-containing protein